MAEQIDNDYIGQSYLDVVKLKRTNPWATETNGLKLYGIKRGDGCHANFWPNFGYTYDANAQTITLQGTFSIDNLRYFKFRINDVGGTGNVYGALDVNSPTTPIVIDVSSLNPTLPWNLLVQAKQVDDDCPCDGNAVYELLVNKVAGYQFTNWNAPVIALRVVQHNGSTESTPADGGTVTDAVSIAQNAVTSFSAFIKNNGSGKLTVSAFAVTGSGSVTFPSPITINPGEESSAIVVTLTTSATGAKTTSVDITSDAVNTSDDTSFAFDYNFTVV